MDVTLNLLQQIILNVRNYILAIGVPLHTEIDKGTEPKLSIVKQSKEEVHGEILVKSTPHNSTCFTCLIPLQEYLPDNNFGLDAELFIPALKKSNSDGAQLKQTPDTSPKHAVLLIEDHTIAQTIACALLESLHCSCDVADSGEKALQLCQEKSYALIFMDIGLPDIDGYEITHRIRTASLSKNSQTPIIGLSAHLGKEHKTKCINSGMNAVLNKPLTFDSCLDILHSYLTPENQVAQSSFFNDLPAKASELLKLDTFPLLDSKEGIKTSGNKNLLSEMLLFLVNEGLPADLALMKNAYSHKDWDKAQQIAHKIKGGALYVGTIKMKMACQYFERYWKTGQQQYLEELYQQMIEVIEATLIEIRHWLMDPCP
ncbi:MAG: hypothetical protein CK426_05190 [Legionella sp.]|nr:MAG: hypothetical protein CK423_01680 [Legionella sp.]PJD98753.1 MAG: hypothetical protein CK426_05190 [Legionella sp.]